MNAAELIAIVRRNTTTEANHPDYPDSVILQELNDSLTTKFQRTVIDSRSGYWLQSTTVTLTSGQSSVRIPPRAIALSKVEIGNGTTPSSIDFRRLPQVQEGHADLFEGSASSLGTPRVWVSRGDQIALIPAADSSGYTLKIWYFIRPSRLCPQQSDVPYEGYITAVNPVSRTITVGVLPVSYNPDGTTSAIVSGSTLIDVVHPNGWHELALVSAQQAFSGTTFNISGTDDMTKISVGDFVRVADQTDWPPIPVDFHRCLADITSVKILLQQDYPQKAMGFAADVNSDLERFSSLIGDRVKEEARTARATLPMLRRRW